MLLGVACVAWSAVPVLGSGWARLALVIAAASIVFSALRLALLDVPEPEEAYFLSTSGRAWRVFLTVVRRPSWEEIGCACVLWLEVLHPSRPWHTAILGAILVAYLLTVHIAESGALATGLLRRQARVVAGGLCLLALAAAASALPAAGRASVPDAWVLAAVAVIAAAILVLPGLTIRKHPPGNDRNAAATACWSPKPRSKPPGGHGRICRHRRLCSHGRNSERRSALFSLFPKRKFLSFSEIALRVPPRPVLDLWAFSPVPGGPGPGGAGRGGGRVGLGLGRGGG